MTPPARLDRSTGAIRLAPETFDAVLAYARAGASTRSSHAEADELGSLRAGGLLRRDTLHPDLRTALEPILAPVCTIELQHGRQSSSGWVSPETASLLVPAEDGLRDLIRMHPSFLPEALARMASLGPRPRAPRQQTLTLGREAVGSLYGLPPGSSTAPVADALPGLEPRVASLLGDLRGIWRARARWRNGQGRPRERTIELLDVQSGLWSVGREDAAVELASTTPTAVWRSLARLLPRDDELGGSTTEAT